VITDTKPVPMITLPVLKQLWVFAADGVDKLAIIAELSDLGYDVRQLMASKLSEDPTQRESTQPEVIWVDLDVDNPLAMLPDGFVDNLNPDKEALLLLGDSNESRYERLTASASSNEANRAITEGDTALAELHQLKALMPRGFYSINLATLRPEERPIKFAMLTGQPVPQTPLTIQVESFGYRYGIPQDAQWVLDVRFLTNPYYKPELRAFTGNDPIIKEFISQQPAYQQFMDGAVAMLSAAMVAYYSEGKRFAPIAIGCTGGQHRSVMSAEAIAQQLRDTLVDKLPALSVTCQHRESARWPKQ
jgi:RNase adaptor protein for sRNA GlmZ degradation